MNEHSIEHKNVDVIYTPEAIERIANALASAPVPARPISKQDAIDRLGPALRAAREKGHTLQGLVDQLAAQGLPTHARAVSAAIARAGASKPGRKKNAARKPPAQTQSIEGAQQ